MYKSIIQKIEFLYSQYKDMTSEVLFNAQTDFLFDSVLKIPYCKYILDVLMSKYPIKDEEIVKKDGEFVYKWLPEIIQKSKEYYLSYCLHAYFYFRKIKRGSNHKNYLDEYYSDIRIFNQGVTASGNRMMVFKTEFIWPLLCYVISNLDEEAHIYYVLNRYKQRVEMFSKESLYSDGKLAKENKLQNDLATFLFDQGIEFSREEQVGNGKMDFCIQDKKRKGISLPCNKAALVIEVKIFTEDKRLDIERWANQLKTYMGRTLAKGCLIIFYDKEVSLKLKDTLDFKYIAIYTGNTPASERKEIIEVIKYQQSSVKYEL